MKISFKLIGTVLAVLLVSGAILSILTFYFVAKTLEECDAEAQRVVARQVSERIDDILYDSVRELEILAGGSLPRDVVKGQTVNKGILEEYFNETVLNSKEWNALKLVDMNGFVVVSSDQSDEAKPLKPGTEEYKAFQTAAKGDGYISDPKFDDDKKGEMFVATPMFESESKKKVIGVMLGHFNWPLISDIFDTYTENLIYLLESNGTLLATNFVEHRSLGSIITESYFGEKFLRPDLAEFLAGKDYTGVFKGFSTNGNSLFTFYKERGYRTYPGKQWVVAVEWPESLIYAEAAGSIGNIAALAPILTMLIAIIVLSIFSRRLLKPIYEMINATKGVMSGDFSRRVTIRSKDELGQLGEAFNQMTTELSQSYRDLENKVEDRTKNLSIKNEKLNSTQKAMLNLMEDLNTEKSAIAQEKNKIDAILHSIGDGVFVVDRDRRIIVFNDVAAQISGFKPREALGQDMRKILRFVYERDNKVNDKFIEEAINTGEIKEMSNHTLLIRKDGTGVPVADSAAPLIYDGKIEGCVVVFRDVTREREIDRMKSEFVSVASHQLRTPLTGIKWLTELISNMKLDKQAREYVEQISASNDRMVHLVNDLLDVSRIETGRKFDIVLQRKNIVPIVTKIIEEQAGSAKKKNIKIECNPDAPKSLMLDIDELKIRQVFENLLSNAVKYSKENTKVSLDCRQEGNDMVFLVKDQGIGIPKKQQSRLFEKFFRADNASTLHVDGTGLGLYIAKAIVEAHGGKMWFESEEGKGSTFYFSIPKKTKLEKEV